MRLKQEQRDFDTVSISTITAGQSLLAQSIALNEPSDRSESFITNPQGFWYMRSSDLILQICGFSTILSQVIDFLGLKKHGALTVHHRAPAPNWPRPEQ